MRVTDTVGRRLGRIPSPLAGLLGAVLVFGLAWALLVPAWQAPDEQAHTAYVQSIAERGELPGTLSNPYVSTEQQRAADAVNADQTAQVLATKPTWSAAAYERWRRAQSSIGGAQRSDGGGPNPAASNPAFYYLSAVPAYAVASSTDMFGRLTVIRVFSLVFLLITVIGAWLLAGELFSRNRLLQLSAAAFAGLLPMVTFISAEVSPDGMLYAVWSLALWLGVRFIRTQSVGDGAALFAIAGVAIGVKATSYALIPALLVALAVVVARTRRVRTPRQTIALLAVTAVAFAIPAGSWIAWARLSDRPVAAQVAGPTSDGYNVREAASYVWQFYLPRLPFQQPIHPSGKEYGLYSIFVTQTMGAFGWLEVVFPDPTYYVLAGILAMVLIAALTAVYRRRRNLNLGALMFMLAAWLSLLAGIHWTEYKFIASSAGGFIQGRYLFPTIAIGGAVVAAAISIVPARWRPRAVGVLLGALVVFQLFSLGLVASRFYA